MKRITLRNSVIAGAAAVAMVATGSLAAPTEAQAGNGKLVGAFLGGAALGFIAGARPVYGAPYYGGCTWQSQKVWDPYLGYHVWRKVKVCY
ncbi:MAG: hypothetical protein ACR2O0_13170 [Rhizobiaceae bacterium]